MTKYQQPCQRVSVVLQQPVKAHLKDMHASWALCEFSAFFTY